MNYNFVKKHLPKKESFDFFVSLVDGYNLKLIISETRKTKLGDYRSPFKDKGHLISVNGDLEKNHFYLTLLHEVAHMFVFDTYGSSVMPHGKQWKEVLSFVLTKALDNNTFDSSWNKNIVEIIKNPKSSSMLHTGVANEWKKGRANAHHLYIADLKDGEDFILLANNKAYKKIKQLRSNYLCIETETRKEFRVSAYATVKRPKKTNYNERY